MPARNLLLVKFKNNLIKMLSLMASQTHLKEYTDFFQPMYWIFMEKGFPHFPKKKRRW